MNASTILAQHGYTLTQAAQWLSQNANNPREIYATTKALGLSNDMLADILRPSMPSINAAEIDAYFNGNGIATASSALAQHGWTTAQAAQWIQAHLNDPAQIQNAMASLGLDYTMLSEVAAQLQPGITPAQIQQFFQASIPQPQPQPQPQPGPQVPGAGEAVFPTELQNLVSLNQNTGVLSNANVRSIALQQGVSAERYDQLFSPSSIDLNGDGILSTNELGLSALGNLPATSDTVASLLYGTVINVFHALDMQELTNIGNFVNAHANEIAYNPNSPYVAQLESMMVDALSTPAAQPILSDAQIANALGMVVAGMAQNYGNSGALFDDAFSGIFGF